MQQLEENKNDDYRVSVFDEPFIEYQRKKDIKSKSKKDKKGKDKDKHKPAANSNSSGGLFSGIFKSKAKPPPEQKKTLQ